MSDTEIEAGTIDADGARKLLMLESTRWIQKLAEEGYIQKASRGRYITVSVVQGYIRWLKEDRKGKSQSASESRVRDARAAEIEQRTALKNHSLIELAEAEGVIDEIFGGLKASFDGFGAQMTRDIPMRRKIEAGIDDTFRKAAARISETLKALAESGEVVDADAEDDT